MKKKSKKRTSKRVRAEAGTELAVQMKPALARVTKPAIVKAEPQKLSLKQANKRNLAHAKDLRDRALRELQEAVLTYSAAEAAVAGAYLELLSSGNALGKRR